MQLTNNQFRLIKVNECCIRKNQYKQELRKEKFFDSSFGKDVKDRLEKFDSTKYERLNFSNLIFPTRVLDGFYSHYEIDCQNSIYKIAKYDVNFAYINAIICEDFKLPDNQCYKHLFGIQAQIHFDKLNEEEFNQLFGFIR